MTAPPVETPSMSARLYCRLRVCESKPTHIEEPITVVSTTKPKKLLVRISTALLAAVGYRVRSTLPYERFKAPHGT
jgi:hypothetical protein